MDLLERRHQLDTLAGYLRDAAAGNGRLVFVSGEAGIGKTALVHQLSDEVGLQARVAIASCDALSTPGPLGPLIHVGPALGLSPELLMHPDITREQLYAQILAALHQPGQPTLMIAEDAHWADEASLNLLRFLGRRIDDVSTLLVVTHRDDELGPSHPLRIVIGDLASAPGVHRMELPRLTSEAVMAMAVGHGVDATAIYEVTGGNPFFVTEVLAAGGSGTPATVRDAILARAARLSSEGRRLLDAAAVLGTRVDPSVLASVSGGPAEETTEECLSVGIVEHRHGAIAFRHELARSAILDAMSPVRRLVLNRRALEVLEQLPRFRHETARLADHAEGADDRDAVLRYAVVAANQAASLWAHREAAAQWARALRYADHLPPDERAELHEQHSHECMLTGLLVDAIMSAESALALRRQSGARLREGDDLRRLADLSWSSGRNAVAVDYVDQALCVLESLAPGPELARAYATRASLHLMASSMIDAITWGDRAIDLAESFGETETAVYAVHTVGFARAWIGVPGGFASLEHGLALALEHGLHAHATRAYVNLIWFSQLRWRLDDAERYLVEGIAYARAHHLDQREIYLVAVRSVVRLKRSDWTGAADDAREALDRDRERSVTHIVALTTLGHLRARRGDHDPPELDQALSLAERTGDYHRRGPIRAARAEAALFAGDLGRASVEACTVLAEAARIGDSWLVGELVLTLDRAGERDEADHDLPEPYACQLSGDWARAAELWREIGAPYETARALLDGDETAVREAWAIFDGLGARPAAAMAARRLRELGVRQVPRGPRASTRANPGLLTDREVQVLGLIAEGQPNRVIADRLFLSPRTVGHHVSAILGKLDVPTRADAARRAAELDLLQDRSSSSPT